MLFSNTPNSSFQFLSCLSITLTLPCPSRKVYISQIHALQHHNCRRRSRLPCLAPVRCAGMRLLLLKRVDTISTAPWSELASVENTVHSLMTSYSVALHDDVAL